VCILCTFWAADRLVLVPDRPGFVMFPGVPSVRRGWMKFDPPRAQHSPSSEGYLVKATDITRSSHYRHLPPRPPETLTEENPQGD
jgi:hypothetical protein